MMISRQLSTGGTLSEDVHRVPAEQFSLPWYSVRTPTLTSPDFYLHLFNSESAPDSVPNLTFGPLLHFAAMKSLQKASWVIMFPFSFSLSFWYTMNHFSHILSILSCCSRQEGGSGPCSPILVENESCFHWFLSNSGTCGCNWHMSAVLCECWLIFLLRFVSKTIAIQSCMLECHFVHQWYEQLLSWHEQQVSNIGEKMF